MSNLTIEAVPDELVALTTTPEGMALAKAAVLDAFGMGDEQLDEETLAGLRRGLADIAAGRTYSFEEAYSEGREELIARMKEGSNLPPKASKRDDGRRSESPGSIHRAA